MRVGIIEYGGDLTKVFIEEVSKQIETISFQPRKANDLFDVLAYLRKMSECDHLVIIAVKEEEKLRELDAFYDGLAKFEADTGRVVFKCLYDAEEGAEGLVRELAEAFVKAVI